MEFHNLTGEQVTHLKASIKHEHLVSKPMLLKVFVAMVMSADDNGVCAPGENFKNDLAIKLGTSYSVIANAISKLKDLNVIYAEQKRGVYSIPSFNDFSLPANRPAQKLYTFSISVY
jgi:hypothetical protein